MSRLASIAGVWVLLAVVGCSERMAIEPIDYEALEIDACERGCVTMDACGPGTWENAYDGPEPEDCFERCMTLLPRLHEKNQCGSWEITWLRCIGELDCEGYAAFKEGNNLAEHPPDLSAPCVAELHAGCSTDEPFELEPEP